MALIENGISTPAIYAGGVQGKGTGIWDAHAQYVQSRNDATAAVYFPGAPDVSKKPQIVSGANSAIPSGFAGMAEYVQTRLAAPTTPVGYVDGTANVADALKGSLLDIFKNIGAQPDQSEHIEVLWGGQPAQPADNSKNLMIVLGAAAVGLAVILATKGA